MFILKKYMRIVFPVLFALFFPFGAGAQSANITTQRESMTAGELMQAIEQQTDYRFSYNKSLFDVSRRVAVARRTLSLQEVLSCVIQGQRVQYVIRNNYIAIVPLADNSRPQVRKQAAPRTSDVYRPGIPGPAAAPVRREPAPRALPAVEAPRLPEPEPEKAQYSDYSPAAIHSGATGRLPRFALKTNLLYGLATLTPNLAAEAALSPRWTLEAAYSTHPWNYKAKGSGVVNRKLLHGIIRMEGRYWFCDRFSGHFVGAHALYSQYNVNGRDIPLLFDKNYRYEGDAWGGGIAYGYDLPAGNRWNVEFTAGVGVYQMTYDRYSCLTCSVGYTPQKKTWFGPSRLGVSVKFLIK